MARETPLELKTRARAILKALAKTHPDWGPTLEFSTPFELLVATILAAQARDERINLVTRSLFHKYRGPADYLAVPVAELEKDIHATGFYRQKAKAIRACSEQIQAEFGGEVPATMEGLTSLRGVGRKTASIVLGNAFSVPAVAVDRHVARVAQRLRLAPAKEMKEEKIEESLRAVFPKKEWVKATWLFVLHGRRICRPTPNCYECPVILLCPYPKKQTKVPISPAIRRATPRGSSRRR
ncbi:MAG: endonuclease III [Chloroflexota bacterium]|nr:endonuclease III [Chloroflexota bacterium]